MVLVSTSGFSIFKPTASSFSCFFSSYSLFIFSSVLFLIFYSLILLSILFFFFLLSLFSFKFLCFVFMSFIFLITFFFTLFPLIWFFFSSSTVFSQVFNYSLFPFAGCFRPCWFLWNCQTFCSFFATALAPLPRLLTCSFLSCSSLSAPRTRDALPVAMLISRCTSIIVVSKIFPFRFRFHLPRRFKSS